MINLTGKILSTPQILIKSNFQPKQSFTGTSCDVFNKTEGNRSVSSTGLSFTGYSRLSSAIIKGNRGTLEGLLKNGADPNVQSGPLNNTPAHHAVYWCDNESLKMLLDTGKVNPFIKNGLNKTPREFAEGLLRACTELKKPEISKDIPEHKRSIQLLQNYEKQYH